MRIFIAGPYGDYNPKHVIAQNVANADAVGRDLVAMGHQVYIPHKMTWGWEDDVRLTRDDYLRLDNSFLELWAEAIFRLLGESPGADHEVSLARILGKPVFTRLEDVP